MQLLSGGIAIELFSGKQIVTRMFDLFDNRVGEQLQQRASRFSLSGLDVAEMHWEDVDALGFADGTLIQDVEEPDRFYLVAPELHPHRADLESAPVRRARHLTGGELLFYGTVMTGELVRYHWFGRL